MRGSNIPPPFLEGDELFEINGIKWELYFVDSMSEKLIREDESRTVGMTELDTNSVYIANNLSPEFEWKVICHEVVHCAMFSYNIYLTVQEEELIADLIATYGREIIEIADKIFSRLHRRWTA